MDRTKKMYFSQKEPMNRVWDMDNWRVDLRKMSKLFGSEKQDIRSEKQAGNIKSGVIEDRVKESKSGYSGKAFPQRE